MERASGASRGPCAATTGLYPREVRDAAVPLRLDPVP